jgi:hypothetical protein
VEQVRILPEQFVCSVHGTLPAIACSQKKEVNGVVEKGYFIGRTAGSNPVRA